MENGCFPFVNSRSFYLSSKANSCRHLGLNIVYICLLKLPKYTDDILLYFSKYQCKIPFLFHHFCLSGFRSKAKFITAVWSYVLAPSFSLGLSFSFTLTSFVLLLALSFKSCRLGLSSRGCSDSGLVLLVLDSQRGAGVISTGGSRHLGLCKETFFFLLADCRVGGVWRCRFGSWIGICLRVFRSVCFVPCLWMVLIVAMWFQLGVLVLRFHWLAPCESFGGFITLGRVSFSRWYWHVSVPMAVACEDICFVVVRGRSLWLFDVASQVFLSLFYSLSRCLYLVFIFEVLLRSFLGGVLWVLNFFGCAVVTGVSLWTTKVIRFSNTAFNDSCSRFGWSTVWCIPQWHLSEWRLSKCREMHLGSHGSAVPQTPFSMSFEHFPVLAHRLSRSRPSESWVSLFCQVCCCVVIYHVLDCLGCFVLCVLVFVFVRS